MVIAVNDTRDDSCKSTYDYNEALEECEVYFNGDELASKVFLDKYALRDNQQNLLEMTPKDMHRRIAKEFARIEKGKFKKPLSEEEIFNYLDHFKRIVPQGSPMYGIGNNAQTISLSNCYVLESPLDSYGGIHLTDEQLSQISKRRGGVGLDISHLRPGGTVTHNAARTSTGIGSFMERYSNSIREVGQAGRRGALMITINVHHPEVLTFATIKSDSTKVTGANISIRLTDKFLTAVKNDTTYTQQWPIDSEKPEIVQEVSAREVWMKIIENAHAMAEPGLLFWDNIISESPSDCYADVGFKTICTNPSLRGSTRVLTTEGAIPIEELAQDKPFGTRVKNLRGEWSECHVFQSGKDKTLWKIEFTNGQSVYCTPEHKWPVINTSGNLINPQTGRVKKKRTDEMSRLDKIYFPLTLRAINNPYSNMSKEDGFILGWSQGDGWRTFHKEDNAYQYGFIFSSDEGDIGNRVLDYTNKLAKVSSSLRKDHQSEAITFCTTDSNVRDKMDSIGFVDNSEGVPESIWRGSSDAVSGYVDGLFSSDGYVRVSKKLSHCYLNLTTSHKKMSEDIQRLLSFYGISSQVGVSHTSEASFPNKKKYDRGYTRYDLRISGSSAKKFAQCFTLSSARKQSFLDEINSKSLEFGKKNFRGTHEYLVVKSVEQTDIAEDVYDITVFDDTHTFFMESGLTGNCSEIPLSALDSCRLLLLNLYSYVKNPFARNAEFDWEQFYEDAQVAQRLMDDLIDLEIEKIDAILEKIKSDPEPVSVKRVELEMWQGIKEACLNGRRTGTGITALGDAIAAIGFKYGSPKSLEFTEKIYKTIKLGCYRSSVDMAKEIGPFPIFDASKEKDCPFLLRIKDEDPKLYADMQKFGRRNIALLTTAPAGSVSIETQTTSGIEPLFMIYYTRKKKINPDDQNARSDSIDQTGDHWQHFRVVHPRVKDWLAVKGISEDGMTDEEFEEVIKKSPWYGCCAEDLDWNQRVKIQALANLHVDHAISSTLNLPEDVTVEKVAEIYQAAWEAGCKGITVYRKNCRTGVMIESKKEVVEEKISVNNAPKRPSELPCAIHHHKVKGEDYFVIVGLLDGEQPYEVFAGKNGFIPKKATIGSLTKVKRGHYRAVFEEGVVIENVIDYMTPEEEALTRLTSTSLRHGADVGFVVHQLEKSKGDFMSFDKAMARALKKYIIDGSKVHGEECPSCSSGNLVRQDGCCLCKDCGYSKCG